jgi:hypothetical protein
LAAVLEYRFLVRVVLISVPRWPMWFDPVLAVLAFPCFRVGMQALPLCGAAPTFLCSGKEK